MTIFVIINIKNVFLDSLTHRAKVRQKLDKKEAWVNNYISHAMPFLAKLENSLVCVPSWFEQPDSCDKQGGKLYCNNGVIEFFFITKVIILIRKLIFASLLDCECDSTEQCFRKVCYSILTKVRHLFQNQSQYNLI